MTDAATQKPIQDPEAFGRDIAQHAMAEIREIGIALAEIELKEQQLRMVAERSVLAIDAAALAHVADGMPAAAAKEWAKAAVAALGAAMDEHRAPA